jgi:hypothetical protein
MIITRLLDLVEEGVAQMSPSAAIAIKLSKSGLSLTQVYTQLVACEEELMTTKDENSRLNSYIEQVPYSCLLFFLSKILNSSCFSFIKLTCN